MTMEWICTCGTRLCASQQHGGLLAVCPSCDAQHTVPATTPSTAPDDSTSLCLLCGERIVPSECVCCRHCQHAYHRACFERNQRCISPDCTATIAKKKAILHSRQENETRPCPACGGTIPFHAQRCRHCGKRFAAGTSTNTPYSLLAITAFGSGVLSIVLLIILFGASGANLLLLPGMLALFGGIASTIQCSRGIQRGLPCSITAIVLGSFFCLLWLIHLFV